MTKTGAGAIVALLVCRAALAVGSAAPAVPQWRVQAERIGPRQPADAQRVMSNDGRRYAYVKTDGAQSSVVVDGKAGPPFEEIREESLIFSADGKRFGYVAIRPRNRVVDVVDGEVSSEHDNVGALSFSPDGKHMSYLVCDKDVGRR